jgi:hypothetical protein
MSILSFLSAAILPVTELIGELHTSTKEEGELQIKAGALKLQFQALTNQITGKVIELESQLLTAKQDIIVTEAKSASFLTSNWRPITMLTLLFMIVADGFGWLVQPLPDDAWTVIKIGLGGYVTGRSLEKIIPQTLEVMKK